jgi:hypothetical protein
VKGERKSEADKLKERRGPVCQTPSLPFPPSHFSQKKKKKEKKQNFQIFLIFLIFYIKLTTFYYYLNKKKITAI